MAAESTRVIYAAIAANLVIAVTKFIAAGFTGSSAMPIVVTVLYSVLRS